MSGFHHPHPSTSVADLSTNSLLRVFSNRALSSPFPIALGLGFTAISYFTWSNIGAGVFGVVPMVGSAKEREKLGLEEDPRKCVELWAWYFEQAAPSMAISGLLSSVSLATSAFLAPSRKAVTRSSLRTLVGSAAGLAGFIVPYTLLRMLPINKILLNYRDQIVYRRKPHHSENGEQPPILTSATASLSSASTVSALSEQEDARMMLLLTRWQEMHRWRVIAGVGAWILSFVAIVVSV